MKGMNIFTKVSLLFDYDSLSRKEKVILGSISGIFFIGGALFGVLWGLLLKAISVCK
jgi:hypothetical protein